MNKIVVVGTHCRCHTDNPHGVSVLGMAEIPGYEISLWDGEGALDGVRLMVVIFHPRSGLEWGLRLSAALLARVPILPLVWEHHHADFDSFADWRHAGARSPNLFLPPLYVRTPSGLVPGLREVLDKLAPPVAA